MTQIVSQNNFNDIINIIEQSKSRALKAVNAEMINMYWKIGKYLSELCNIRLSETRLLTKLLRISQKKTPI